MIIPKFYKTNLIITDTEVNLYNESSIVLKCQLIDYNGNPIMHESATFIVDNTEVYTGKSNKDGIIEYEYDCSALEQGYHHVRVNESVGFFRVFFAGQWIILTPASGYSHYEANMNQLACRKRDNNIVEVRGVLRNSSALSTSSSFRTLATLPEGYRPTSYWHKPMQGSNMNRIEVQINTSGTITWRAYGTTANTTMAQNTWINIHATFMVD